MGCLDKILCGERVIIGIRDYADCASPESDLFINDAPGMSLKLASKIASEEYETGAKLLRAKINLATKLVFDEFKEKISPYFDFDAVVETREINNFGTKIIPKTALERGLVLKRWRSELAKIYVENVYVRSVQSGVGVVKIIDGSITKSYNVDLIANKTIEVFTNYTAVSETVKIVMDDTNFDVYSCDISSRSSCGPCNSSSGKGFVIKGWDGAKEDLKCYGIGVTASVRCYEENIICSLLPRMYFLIWQKSVIETLKEQQFGTRINPLVNLTREEAKENRVELEKEYKTRYNSFVKSIYNYLRQTKGECITCNGNRYVQSHP